MNRKKLKKRLLILGLALGLSLYSVYELSVIRVYAEEYVYDDLNRLVKVIYDDGSYVEYTYDSNGNIVQTIVVNSSDDKTGEIPEEDGNADDAGDDEGNDDNIDNPVESDDSGEADVEKNQGSLWRILNIMFKLLRNYIEWLKSTFQ